MFWEYLQYGIAHIADIQAYDHILFIVAACCIYPPQQWRKVLILVTAFTLGHSLTLALAGLDILRANPDWVEFLIPVTIAITCFSNLAWVWWHKDEPDTYPLANYPIVLCFGLIHGLGFSNYFRMITSGNMDITTLLLGFNLGVEVGQLGIVALYMLVSALVLRFILWRHWVITISSLIVIAAIQLMLS